MIVSIPMPLPSAANLREHWRVRAKRIKTQRATVAMFLRGPAPALPVVVTLTRIAPEIIQAFLHRSVFIHLAGKSIHSHIKIFILIYGFTRCHF